MHPGKYRQGWLFGIMSCAMTWSQAACAGVYPFLGTQDSPTPFVTTQGVLQSSANALMNMLENRLIAEPSPLLGLTFWGNAEYDRLENHLSSTAYQGHITYTSLGLDNRFDCVDMALGMAILWEEDDFSSSFNRGSQKTDGIMIIPYLAKIFSPYWRMMLLLGYERLDNDLQRTEIVTGNRLFGTPRGKRYFGGGELIFQVCNEPWTVAVEMAALYLHQSINLIDQSTTSSFYAVTDPDHDNYLWRLKLGTNIEYSWSERIDPYIAVALLWDFAQTDIITSVIQAAPANTDLAGLFTIGCNIAVWKNMLINLNAYTEAFREDYTHWGTLLNIKIALA